MHMHGDCFCIHFVSLEFVNMPPKVRSPTETTGVHLNWETVYSVENMIGHLVWITCSLGTAGLLTNLNLLSLKRRLMLINKMCTCLWTKLAKVPCNQAELINIYKNTCISHRGTVITLVYPYPNCQTHAPCVSLFGSASVARWWVLTKAGQTTPTKLWVPNKSVAVGANINHHWEQWR